MWLDIQTKKAFVNSSQENEFVELTEQILANQPGGGANSRLGRRLSVDTTTLKFAKFLQKWCDGKGITSIVKYNFVDDTELYEVELELMGTKGNWRASDGDIRSALNEVSR